MCIDITGIMLTFALALPAGCVMGLLLAAVLHPAPAPCDEPERNP